MLWSKIIWKFKTRHFMNFIQITGFLIQGNYDFTFSVLFELLQGYDWVVSIIFEMFIYVTILVVLKCWRLIWHEDASVSSLFDICGCFSPKVFERIAHDTFIENFAFIWDMNKMSGNRFDMCFWRPSIFLIDHPTHTGSCLSAVFIWFQAHVYLPIHTSTWRNLIPSQH